MLVKFIITIQRNDNSNPNIKPKQLYQSANMPSHFLDYGAIPTPAASFETEKLLNTFTDFFSSSS